jgi:hypothetical protein
MSLFNRDFDFAIKNEHSMWSVRHEKIRQKPWFTHLLTIYLLTNLGSLFQRRRVIVCMLAHCSAQK